MKLIESEVTPSETALFELARDLTCAASLVVGLAWLTTTESSDRCVTVRHRGVPGECRLVVRPGHVIEIWWVGEAEVATFVGVQGTVAEVLLLLARRYRESDCLATARRRSRERLLELPATAGRVRGAERAA